MFMDIKKHLNIHRQIIRYRQNQDWQQLQTFQLLQTGFEGTSKIWFELSHEFPLVQKANNHILWLGGLLVFVWNIFSNKSSNQIMNCCHHFLQKQSLPPLISIPQRRLSQIYSQICSKYAFFTNSKAALLIFCANILQCYIFHSLARPKYITIYLY